MSNPPCEEMFPALKQPMQTRSTRKKFKVEICSKRNEERHKPSGKTPEDPEMNPAGSVELPPEGFEDFSEDENVASQCPPYLLPVRPGVQPPRWTTKFTLRTPLLPQDVQLVRMEAVRGIGSLIDSEGPMIPMNIINIMKRKMTPKDISRRKIAE